ncbi:MAG TPA: polysaccharide deacetylase family protein [Candidatus Limnocylindria bacterium]|nr:polysaccharide deacetylase family protein [Candidatus Limnocylindria bacterium]
MALTLRAKGLAGLATRAETIRSRFGVDDEKTRAALDRYLDIVGPAGVGPTLPMTAVVLSRHARLAAEYSDRGVEFAVHGLVHSDHANTGLESQLATIAEAADRFAAAGVPFSGFRGPYLRESPDTQLALRRLGFRYDSTQALHFPVLDASLRSRDGYRRALALYRALPTDRYVARPRMRDGLVDIPVTVPDDEMFVERLGLGPEEQSAAWRAILRETHREEELFTVMLHPERIFDCGAALADVLAEARALRTVWIARLDEVADWWRRRSLTRVEVREVEAGRFRAISIGDPEVTLSLHRPPHGAERIPAETGVEFLSPVRPLVGVSPLAPRELLDFLREEGYLVEATRDPLAYAAFIGITDETWSERGVLATIADAKWPVARLSRWPAAATSALAVSGDIDSVTLQDFFLRLWETR